MLFIIDRLVVRNNDVYIKNPITPTGRFLEPLGLDAGLFAITNDGKLLISAGYWDNSIKITLIDLPIISQVFSTVYHEGRVTCISLTENYGTPYLVSGSEDTTIRVSEIICKDNKYSLVEPFSVLYGHNDKITSVLANSELGVIFSSSPGLIVIHVYLKESLSGRLLLLTLQWTKQPPNSITPLRGPQNI